MYIVPYKDINKAMVYELYNIQIYAVHCTLYTVTVYSVHLVFEFEHCINELQPEPKSPCIPGQ